MRYTDPMGRNTIIAINPNLPFLSLSHGGLTVETGDGKWSFFEFDDNEIFPGKKLREMRKITADYAGCMKYDF